jgi:hypothetical protein
MPVAWLSLRPAPAHKPGWHRKDQSARKPGQIPNLAGPERKARVTLTTGREGVASGSLIWQRQERNRTD